MIIINFFWIKMKILMTILKKFFYVLCFTFLAEIQYMKYKISTLEGVRGEKKEDSLLIISFYHHQKSLLFPISYIFLGLAEFLTNIMPNMIGDFYYYDQFRIPPLSREHRR